ncbi:uncharacterized protein B0I36DRAFT_323244 [Microdochium trichocladiopsis]|uniref:Uncharacterized protein n=1 Tax=Microdochium trichocladiopsis TaxID=1682393 RepID=A0A9P8Y9F7_9PEZI|nr:uncharacterized protein B0I36DRAFT_323244 [Microdochium trichocladiopsis]KAH7031125.1 hypothetical protein B0I36DRAFT_323244 [Microdochium trichocladiopsis]
MSGVTQRSLLTVVATVSHLCTLGLVIASTRRVAGAHKDDGASVSSFFLSRGCLTYCALQRGDHDEDGVYLWRLFEWCKY